jgi:hypothetical protein
MLAFALGVAAPRPAGAQPPPPGVDAALDAARAVRGASLEVSVLTFANGEVLWERFGHNALVVSDTVQGRSVAYNWGVFDFDQPNFLMRFLTGDTRYWLAAYPTAAMFDAYVSEDRSARLQVLAITDVQKAALAEFVEWQSLEENRYYRYDYYLDNCSTRVRDAIDRVLGGVLARDLSDVPAAPRTWREETARVTDGDWPPFAGIHVALGRNADRALTRWHESFLPGLLADHLATVEIGDGAGGVRPLVARDTVLFTAARAPLPDRAPSRIGAAIALGAVLATLIVLLGQRSGTPGIARGALRTVAFVWYLVGGLLGTALLLAGTVTKHAAYMGTNATLAQVHPVLLVGALCALFAGRSTRLARGLARVAMISAVLSLLGLVVGAAFMGQRSWVVLAVTVPVHLALAIALRQLVPPPTPPAVERRAEARAA